jgi:LPXTG-motif cell wall-anchored protein
MTAASQALDAADSTVGTIPAIDGTAMPVRDAVRGAATQGDLDAARSLGVKQQALATEVSAALATKTAPRDVIQEFGLLGTTLPLDSAAIDAVARIDSEGATVMTDQIRSLIAGARDTGTQRLATTLGAVIALGLLLLLGAVVLRRRRRRRRSPGTGPPLVVDLPTES